MTDHQKNRTICFRHGILIFLILLIFSQSGRPQMYSNITHFPFTGMAINPAFAGTSDAICVTGLMRQQWIGLKDNTYDTKIAPQTYFITIDAPLSFLHGGLGGSLIQDKIANFSNIYLKLAYAYHADLGAGTLSAGLLVNVVNTKIDKDYTPRESGDPVLEDNNKSGITADAGIGLLYRVPDKYYLGFSVENLLESTDKKINYTLDRTFILHGGYNWQLPGKPAFELQPSALIKTDLASLVFDLNAVLMYNKKFWGGLSYRGIQDMVAILAGLSIKGVKVGLSYDLALSKISAYQSGTVEVMVNYCFKIQTEKFRKSYRNTRFL